MIFGTLIFKLSCQLDSQHYYYFDITHNYAMLQMNLLCYGNHDFSYVINFHHAYILIMCRVTHRLTMLHDLDFNYIIYFSMHIYWVHGYLLDLLLMDENLTYCGIFNEHA